MFRYLASGIKAGIIAGFSLGILNLLFVSPLILKAEKYEVPEVHNHGLVNASALHHHPEASPGFKVEGTLRSILTVVGNTVLGIAVGTLVAALILIAIRFDFLEDKIFNAPYTQALIVGIGFFAIANIVPSLGMKPEMPGIIGGENNFPARQHWWIISAIFSFSGFCFFWFRKKIFSNSTLKGITLNGVAMAIACLITSISFWVIGVPEHSEKSTAPMSLRMHFVWESLTVNFIFWMILSISLFYFVRKEFKQELQESFV